MALGQIPLVAVFEYVDRYALPEWAIDAVLRIDAQWLAMVNDDGDKRQTNH